MLAGHRAHGQRGDGGSAQGPPFPKAGAFSGWEPTGSHTSLGQLQKARRGDTGPLTARGRKAAASPPAASMSLETFMVPTGQLIIPARREPICDFQGIISLLIGSNFPIKM